MNNHRLRDILNHLIDRYGDDLNINKNNFSSEFSNCYEIHQKTINSWFFDEPKIIRRRSVAALVDYFSSQIPSIQPSWFYVESLDAFKKLENNAVKKTIKISLEVGSNVVTGEHIQETIADLQGDYSIYRYAFENTGRIANELVSFYQKGNQLMCRWYFRILGFSIKTLRMSEGHVLPIGNNYYILTTTKNPDYHASARVRTMLLGKLSANREITKYRHGIVLSSVCSTDEPCSARVVLRRNDNITNIQNYAEKHVNFSTENEFKENHPREYCQLLEDINNQVTQNNDFVMTIATSDFARRWGRRKSFS